MEDNLTNQEVATLMLRGFGCEVVSVDNGIEALKAWQQDRFDLILMDCLMPEMDGFETTSRLRRLEQEQDQDQHIPIIALTAGTDQETRRHCRSVGMDDFLGKPLVRVQLQTTLACWLEPVDEVQQLDSNEGLSGKPTDLVLERADILDGKVLREISLLQLPNQPDLVQHVVEIFLNETPELLKSLDLAAASGDFETLRRHAHTLKSSSAHLGAVTLPQFAKELEACGRNKDLQDVDCLMQQIKQGYKDLAQLLEMEILSRTA